MPVKINVYILFVYVLMNVFYILFFSVSAKRVANLDVDDLSCFSDCVKSATIPSNCFEICNVKDKK